MVGLVLTAVFIASVAQRATGMGHALIAAPLLVLALGPGAGVLLVNALGLITSVLAMWRAWNDIEWSLLLLLVPPALVGIALGTGVMQFLPRAWAQIAIGLLIVAALVAASRIPKRRFVRRGYGAATAATASGAMGAMAGVGGPALVVWRNLTRWDHLQFAATMQPYFLVTGGAVILARLWSDASAWPQFEGPVWVAILAALMAGVAVGDLVLQRLPIAAIDVLLTAVAGVGAVWTVVDGLVSL